MDFQDMFRYVDLELLGQLGLAVLLGGVVGLERELRGRAAGLRTMIIVCLGSTLVMVVSARLPLPVDASRSVIRADPGRIAAGIVTGVGFLGAGVILKIRDLIRGVTTAACIWFVAGVGIAIGEGMNGVAILGTAICIFTLWGLRFVERLVRRQIYRNLVLRVDSSRTDAVLEHVFAALKKERARTMDLEITEDCGEGITLLDLAVRAREDVPATRLVQQFASLEGVRQARWGVSY